MMDLKPWVALWRDAYHWPQVVPEWVLAAIVLLLLFSVVIVPGSWIFSYVERKLSADLQARIGPNRTGFGGFFQPLADLLKLLGKNVSRSTSEPYPGGGLWLVLRVFVLFASLATLPLSSGFLLMNSSMSVFLPLLALVLLGFVSLYSGVTHSRSEPVLGALRIGAQTLSGALPALLAILAAAMETGSYRWGAFHEVQGFLPYDWVAFASPFAFLSFFIFSLSGLVILGIPPLDSPFSRMELGGGMTGPMAGYRVAIYQITRFYGFLLWAVCATAIFLGGWNLPGGLEDLYRSELFFLTRQVSEALLVLCKSLVLMLAIVLLGKVTPRIRVDQITRFCWIVLTPTALLSLMGSVLWVVVFGSGRGF